MKRALIPRRTPSLRMAGLSLVELMVSITISLLVALAATSLLLSSKSSYSSVDDGSRLQDSGRYAIEIISRNIRQTAYEQWDRDDAPILMQPPFSANISGLDAQMADTTDPGISVTHAADDTRSDVLALRFFGSSNSTGADGTIQNCAGISIPAPSPASADQDRGWSIFYVANGAGGSPDLRCKYYSNGNWQSDVIVSGVESFQVLYGLDTTATQSGIPRQYVNAKVINDLDAALQLVGADDAARARDKNSRTNWKKVVSVKIAMLMRGTQALRQDAMTQRYDLFGQKYSDVNADRDAGTMVREADMTGTSATGAMPAIYRNRLRKVFSATIELRNH